MANESFDFVPNTQKTVDDLNNIRMEVKDLKSTPCSFNIPNSKKKKKSYVWTYLTKKLNDLRKCTCNIFSKGFTCGGLVVTRHLGRHVRTCLKK